MNNQLNKITDTKDVKGSENHVKKQNSVRPSSILPTLMPPRKPQAHETSADSGKSSRASSRISIASDQQTDKKNELNEANQYLDLIIYGNSVMKQTCKANSLPTFKINDKMSNASSKISVMSDQRPVFEENTSRKSKESCIQTHDSPTVRKTTRTNSLPGIINRRYSIETSTIRQAKQIQIFKKSSRKKSTAESETKSAECVFHENLALDLSQMSDFADSEDETLEWDKTSKQKVTKNQAQSLSRRRRSIDKDKSSSSRSGLPKSIPCTSRSSFARRNSLQSFSSPRGLSFASSFESPSAQSKIPSLYCPRNNEQCRLTSPSNIPDTPSTALNSGLSRNSDPIYSSASPDYTSEPSTCDNSPCKLSPNRSIVSALDKTKYASIDSAKATVSPMSQMPCLSSSSSCYTSWMERSIESEFTCPKDQENDSMEANVSDDTPVKERGEWNSFWRNYNSSLAMFPKKFYDDCPTPFYHDSQGPVIPSEEYKQKTTQNGPTAGKKIDVIEESKNADNSLKCIYLSKNEAQEMIHCAHRLAEILTLALEKKNNEGAKEPRVETKEIQVKDKHELKRSISETKILDSKYAGRLDMEGRKGLPLVLELNESCVKVNGNAKSLNEASRSNSSKDIKSHNSATLQNDSKDVLL